MTKELQSQLGLVQGYYHFLMLGMWAGHHIKHHNMADKAHDIQVAKQGKYVMDFSGEMIGALLRQAAQSPGKQNILEYMTFVNGVRGVLMTTREMIEGSKRFREYLYALIGSEQYADLDYLLRFLRNVLVHMTDPRIMISHEGFRAIRDIDADWKKVDLQIDASRLRKDEQLDYHVHILCDIATIKHNTRLTDVISEYQLYALTRLCYDIARLYI
jgi:hypothetical protein